jgi:hypothetical protein
MKCLSLIQPWATLIILGAKRIETRSWHTSYRGPLLIHASQCKSFDALVEQEPFKSAIIEGYGVNHLKTVLPLPRGYILGAVNLDDCQPVERLAVTERFMENPNEQAFGDYSPGRFAWLLSNPQPLVSPIPYKGKLGIFEVPDEALEGASYV